MSRPSDVDPLRPLDPVILRKNHGFSKPAGASVRQVDLLNFRTRSYVWIVFEIDRPRARPPVPPTNELRNLRTP